MTKSCCEQSQSMNLPKGLTIGLVGNPNCGKTTVFNALTGARQHVGNWPGVTVERKSGFFRENKLTVEAVDLPGTYSLSVASDASSIDERIACDFILNREVDVVINILDASNLERNLYLTLQLLEMQVPLIIAVNMMDVAKQRGMQISLDKLSSALGCTVVPLEANKSKGICELKNKIVSHTAQAIVPTLSFAPDSVKQAIQTLSSHVHSDFLAIRLLENDAVAHKTISADMKAEVDAWQDRIHAATGEDADILLADARYRFIQQIMHQCVTKVSQTMKTWTSRIDSIVLNRVLGLPIFLGVMYFMFFFAINIGGAFQDFFDIGSNTLFVDGFAHFLTTLGTPTWLTVLLANGVGKGINTTITFVPVIGAMFLFLAFLEDSGYMSRAAFVVDRVMRMLGLPGKSFVPMIVGFGCNVPGVMAARTLENKRDRILTVMMSPFMSCSARLAIFAVFTAAFFPKGGQNVIFALYLLGILMAMLTGFLLRKTVLTGSPAPLVMEMPPYHLPNVKTLFLLAWQRLKGFLFRAGKLIIPICVLIGALNSLNMDGSMNGGDGDAHSLLSTVGQWLTPIFAPMGIHPNNWPATVGLVTGVLAKEVVIGTLNTLYSQLGHLADLQASGLDFWGGLREAVMSVPSNLAALGSSLGNPVLAKAPVHTVSQGVYGVMFQQFDGQVGAIAYLLFVLLYFPCISTTAAMVREVNRAWALFSVIWTTGIAYCTAVAFYQAATFLRHPFSSSMWLIGIAATLASIVLSVRAYTTKENRVGGDYEFA